MTPNVPDAASRSLAATDFTSNPVVVAGAGTGKTGLLVERYLNLILSGRAGMEHTVALTFTEKAAGEMRTRVVEGLEDILLATGSAPAEGPGTEREAGRSLAWLRGTAGVPDPELHRRAAAALDDLESASIGTIHGFCSELLRRHPDRTGLPPEFTIDEGYGQDLLFEEVWSEFLASELGGAPERPDLWKGILSRFLESEIESVAVSLSRDPVACDFLADRGYRGLDVLNTYRGPVTELVGELRRCQGQIKESGRSRFPQLLRTSVQLLEAFLERGSDALRAADPGSLEVPDIFDRSNPFTPSPLPEFLDRKETMRGTGMRALRLLKRLRKVHDMAFPDLMEGLRPFAKRLRERVLGDGMLSFSDLLLLARNLLRDHPEVRRRESDRFRAILVDEFQDTDPLQYEIVFLLATAEKGRIEDPYEAPLLPGRLFIVGDPKQSIYRFRGADISAYTRASGHILDGAEATSLVTNFRSRPEILTPVNTLFEGWVRPETPEDQDIEPEYEPIEPFKEEAGDSRVELWSIDAGSGARAEARRRAEARHLAHCIRAWIDAGTWEREQIALLFRSLGDAPIYTRALRDAGVRFVVDGGKAFAERPEVVEAFALLKAVANPADPVATLGVLRSSMGGVPDTILTAYARDGGRFRWTEREEIPARYPPIQRLYRRLRALEREMRHAPLDRWIQRTLTETEFALLMTAHFEGAQRLANVRKLAERAAGLARERGFTLEQTITALEGEFGDDRVEGESPLADEGLDAVRILTIHKAKGLEFPVVIVPDLSRTRPAAMRKTQATVMRVAGVPHLAVWMPDRMKVQNTAACLVDEDRNRHEDAENKRLLYVATTRAKELLILVNSLPRLNNDWLKRIGEAWHYRPDANLPDPFPADDSVLPGGVRHRVYRGVPGIRRAAARTEEPAEAHRSFRRAVEAAAAPRPPRFRNPSGDHRAERDVVDPGEEPEPRDPEIARVAGTAVHRALELWDFRDPGSLRERALEASESPGAGPGAGALRKAIERVVEGFLASGLPAYLASVEVLGREVPVLFTDRGTTVHGYADLVYRHQGRIHVADYKTDEITTAEHAEIYREQLADYAAAIERGLGLAEPPVAEVLFVRSGDRIPLGVRAPRP